MNARAFYFRTLGRMTESLSAHSDVMMAETFSRLGKLFRLMDLRTAAGEEPTIDLLKSGFPILKEVVQVAKDLELGVLGEVHDEVVLRAVMLDDMLLRRRMPDERAIKNMAQAVYSSAIAAHRSADEKSLSQVFQPNSDRSLATQISGERVQLSWDFWDGTTSRAIRTYAVFDLRKPYPGGIDVVVGDEILAIGEVAKRFSGASFTPLTLATEIDDVAGHLRLQRLAKVTVGPFISEIFSKVDDPIMDAIKAADDIEDAWAIRWTIDHIRAGSTSMVGGGLFRAARPQQNFIVDTLDPDCASRSVTSFDRHVAMPHGMFQRLAKRRNECSSLKSAAIHVLTSEGRLIENN